MENTMDLEGIKSRHVLEAVREFGRLGRGEFVKQYGFGKARSYWLVHEGRSYDAKAIFGAARGYARPELGPLSAKNSVNSQMAKRKLEDLEFEVTDSESDHTIPPGVADDSPFDPAIVEDTRDRTLRAIYQRRGQQQFRDSLFAAYDGYCMVTGCSVPDVLEAAHIHPYVGSDTNKVDNGLLLRADVHTLFDCGRIAIDPDSMTVLVATELEDSEYGPMRGRRIRSPQRPSQRPSAEALRAHMKRFGWRPT